MQIDGYYSTGRESTGEVLRLRTEGGETIFSYKGPSASKTVRTQPRLEFSLGIYDDELKRNFESVCGGPTVGIRKERTAYSLDGIVVYVDKKVERTEPTPRNLGEFTEICWTTNSERKARRAMEQLDLKDPISAPYINLAKGKEEDSVPA